MPSSRREISFGPYRLDLDGAQLLRGPQPIALQRRPLAVLAYLAERPGVVVSRDELLAKLWAGTFVTKAVLKVAVRSIREALEDDAEAPRYVETVGREGYRFIAGGEPSATHRTGATTRAPGMVGRDTELARLLAALAAARSGTRAMIFVTGEAGIGKTTLLDRFGEEVGQDRDVLVARGQCLEQYGEGEPYLPILEALGTLVRDDAAGAMGDAVLAHAPTWVPHLTALTPPGPARPHPGSALATMPARMVREMADALDVVARDRLVVLMLEDLQWSDRSSVELLACVAQRRQAARLLVVGTLRTIDVPGRTQAFPAVQQELVAKGVCEEIALNLLSRADVADYLSARFEGIPAATLRQLATRVYERTEGNALFMVNMINDLVAGGVLAQRDGVWHVEPTIEAASERIPPGLTQLLGRRMSGLTQQERRMLEVASVAGDEFAVATVAGAVQDDPGDVEDACEHLASQGALLVDAGLAEWPDGSISGRYRFRHALYRQVLYEGIAEARRVRLHRSVGSCLETGLGAQARDHAAELAMHATLGRDHERAHRFHERAAAAAVDRHAAHEALAHATAALEALGHLPDAPDRSRRELELVVARATLLMAIEGYAAPETERAFARARLLCESLPPGPQLFVILRGLVSYHQVRAELDQAETLGHELLRHAEASPENGLLVVQAHYGAGATRFHQGALGPARTHLEAALAAYDPATHHQHILTYGGYDPGVACALWLAWALALQGEFDAASASAGEGMALARRHGESFSLAWAHHAFAIAQQLMGDWPASRDASAEAVRMAEEYGYPYVLGMARAQHGLTLAMLGEREAGIALLRDGVAAVDRTGAALVRPSYLAMLAAAHMMEGDQRGCAARIDEALAEIERTGERTFEAALLVQKGALATAAAGEACLHRAREVARAQGARLFELRAAMALAQRWCEQGRAADARAVLEAASAWCEDRHERSPDVAAARRLLATLGRIDAQR